MSTTTTNTNNTVNDFWHDAHMLREHVLKRIEDRPHLYNNLVVIIQELERNATILLRPEEVMTPGTCQETKCQKPLSPPSTSSSSWTWFRSRKTSVAPISALPTVPPQPPSPSSSSTSSSSPKLICKKAGRPTSHSRYQDLAAIDQILMEQSVLDYHPQLEAKLILLRRRLQTEAVTLERCQSKWEAAMMLAPVSAAAAANANSVLSHYQVV